MRKKILVLSLILSLVLATGCESAEKAPAPTPTESVSTPAPTEGPTLDENALQLTYDLSKKEQEIDGFGAGFTWYSDYAIKAPNSSDIMDLLFKDAGLTILRFKCDYDYPEFASSANTNLAFYKAAKERADARGEKVTTLYTSWSPAAYLKSSGSVKGEGTLRKNESGAYDYDGFAKWWLDAVKAYREVGIPVDVVSIQNECDFIASYESCEFDPAETSKNACYADAFLATYRLMKNDLGDDLPLMIAPETMSCGSTELKAYVKKIVEEAPESIYALGHHLYVGGTSTDNPNYCNADSFMMNFMNNKEYINQIGCKAWQTEFYRGTSLQTANVIQNSLVYENVSAYIYWGGIWASKATDDIYSNNLIIVGRSIPEWPSDEGYLACGDYYVMRHFSEFVRPGYHRIDAAIKNPGSIRMSMYASPDEKRLVAVVINNGKDAADVQLPIDGAYSATQIYQSVLSDKFTADMLYQNKGSLDKNNKLSLPGESLTTIVIDR